MCLEVIVDIEVSHRKLLRMLLRRSCFDSGDDATEDEKAIPPVICRLSRFCRESSRFHQLASSHRALIDDDSSSPSLYDRALLPNINKRCCCARVYMSYISPQHFTIIANHFLLQMLRALYSLRH